MTEPNQSPPRDAHIHETFSQAFQKLVKNNGDIVGMIAYCLYKRQKRLYVENLARRHRTISRRSRRVEVFHQDFFNDGHIADFRDAADHRLTTYVKEFTDGAKNEAYREIALEKRPVRQTDKSKNLSKWIFGVSTSITATIIVGVFVDMDEYFPSIDPFPDVEEERVELPPEFDADVFKVEPAAAPRQSNLPVM